MRKPSGVTSMSSWFLNWRSAALPSISFSMLFLSSPSIAFSRFSNSRLSSSERASRTLGVLRVACTSPSLTWPALLVSTLPPPLRMLVASPAPEPPERLTLSGFWK